ncbi:MAG: leucine-rich repeat domain-containing protein [Bacteroidota bacterium]
MDGIDPFLQALKNRNEKEFLKTISLVETLEEPYPLSWAEQLALRKIAEKIGYEEMIPLIPHLSKLSNHNQRFVERLLEKLVRENKAKYIGSVVELLPKKVVDPILAFNIACLFAQDKKKEKILEAMKYAMDLGKKSEEFRRDYDFEPYFEDPDWCDILENYEPSKKSLRHLYYLKSFGWLPEIRSMEIDFEKTEVLGENFVGLNDLDHITFKNYPSDYQLPEEFASLPSVNSVTFHHENTQTLIPQPILRLPLKRLEIVAANVPCAAHFKDLETLHVHTEDTISTIQHMAGKFPKLKRLIIDTVREATIRFPSEIEQLTTLEELELHGPIADFVVEFEKLPLLKSLLIEIQVKESRIPTKGFAHLQNLEVLTIEGHGYFAEVPRSLAKLQKLKRLSLGYIFTNKKPSLYEEELYELWVDPFPLPDYFASLKNLEELFLSLWPITDLKPLSKLKKLRKLDLEYGNFNDISPLSSCSSLRELNIGGTEVQMLEPLQLLTKLERLNINRCERLRNIEGLRRIPQLKLLDMFGVVPDSIAPVIQHPTLQELKANESILQAWENRDDWKEGQPVVTQEELHKRLELVWEEKSQKLLTQKSLSADIKEAFEKVRSIRPEAVQQLAETIQRDLMYLTSYVEEEHTEPVRFLDYLYHESEGGDFSYAVGREYCYNEGILEYNEVITEEDEWTIGEELFRTMYGKDVEYLEKNRENRDLLWEVRWAQLHRYTYNACKQLEEAGFFDIPEIQDTIQLPFYVSIGHKNCKNPVAYVLNPSKERPGKGAHYPIYAYHEAVHWEFEDEQDMVEEIQDMSPLEKENIKKLTLESEIEITDTVLVLLRAFKNLEFLDISTVEQEEDFFDEDEEEDFVETESPLLDIDTLKPLVKLKKLILKNHQVEDIAAITHMPQLEYLNILKCNQIQDITPILKHPNLKKLRADKEVMAQWIKTKRE